MTTRDHPRSKPHGPRPAEVGSPWNLKNHWISPSLTSSNQFRKKFWIIGSDWKIKISYQLFVRGSLPMMTKMIKTYAISQNLKIFELFYWMLWMIFVLAIYDWVYSENNMLGNKIGKTSGTPGPRVLFLFPILPWAIIKFQIGNRLVKLQGHVRTRPQARSQTDLIQISKKYTVSQKLLSNIPF